MRDTRQAALIAIAIGIAIAIEIGSKNRQSDFILVDSVVARQAGLASDRFSIRETSGPESGRLRSGRLHAGAVAADQIDDEQFDDEGE